MTTVVRTRQPLQVLSMSNRPEPRKSKRLAALYDEQDGDFQFARKSKRPKTEASVEQVMGEEKPRVASAKKASGKGRSAKNHAKEAMATSAGSSVPEEASARRSSRRKRSLDSVDEPEPIPLLVPKKSTRRSTRRTSGEEESRTQKQAPRAKKYGPAEESPAVDRPGRTPEPSSPRYAAEKVALPLSDTPVIDRNKEMRKKGGNGNRRSSLGMRGRRASSLIEMGHMALPHKEVETAEFYKHIDGVGLPEPRRMKQLLTWCGERALSEKPAIGSTNSHAIHGARAIQDQLLKDFQTKSEFSDWFSRDDGPVVEVAQKPNPRNIELEEKAKQLEEKIKRLREEKKAWQALKKINPESEPLFPEPPAASEAASSSIPLPLPDESSLDPAEIRMLQSLTGKTSFDALKARTEARLKAVQDSLEFRIDSLADGVHKLEQRVATAGREADMVLALSASRLKERDERERTAAGTRELPVMEVVRSLGRALPDGG